MKILSRYVLKEHLGPLVFALTALTSLLLLNYIARQFGTLVGKGLPWSAIAEFFLLSIPFTVELTLPMAVLVATLHAFSRLAAENEITALKASGVSLQRVMTPVLFAAAGVTLVMIVFNDEIIPRSNHELAVLQSDIAQKKPTFALREQVINEVSPGKLFLRANHLDESSNRMREVTIYDLSDATRRRTIYADSGNIALAPNMSDLLMTLYHGTMQDVPTNTPAQLQRLYFGTDLIRVKGVANQFQQSGPGQSKGNREMSVCEMQQEVRRARTELAAARKLFVDGIAEAKHAHVPLDPALAKIDTHMPSSHTLGAGYCALMRALRVPTLGAQQPARPGAQPSTPAAITAQPAPPPSPPQSARSLPQLAPPPVTPRRLAPSAGAIAVSGDNTSGPITPSIVEIAKVRLVDAHALVDTYEIEIHKKFALAVACFVFVLLGAPIALRFPRGGVGLTIGVSLFVFALYYVGLTAGSAAASQGLLPPAIAMWGANVLFALVAIGMLARMGREGNTARGGDFAEMMEQLKAWVVGQLRRVGVSRERRTAA